MQANDVQGKIRIIAGKPGLDGHDRGIKVVTRALRDAGMEVVYLGMRLSVDQIASAAVDEDADVVAVNFAAADHLQFGFFRGAALTDPLRLLRGSGQYVRHVKVGRAADVDAAALTALVREAAAAAATQAKRDFTCDSGCNPPRQRFAEHQALWI